MDKSGSTFLIGERVKVKDDLVGGLNYGGIYFNKNMEKYCGRFYIIIDRRWDGSFSLQGANGWIFSPYMLESASEKLDGEHYYSFHSGTPQVVDSFEEAECIGREVKAVLLKDIYGVGSKGDLINVVKIGNNIWLDAKYLPMFGILSDVEGKEIKED